MHKKITPLLFLSLAITVSALAPATHAQLVIGALENTSGYLGSDTRNNATSSDREAGTASEEHTDTTTSTERNTNARNASTSDRANGLLTIESHRSTVASFVQSLLTIANREGTLGVQIQEIAQAQKASEATTTNAIEKVTSRSSLKTLFLGSDYENLSILRSKMTETQSHLDQLNTILASTTNTTGRTALATQITILAQDQADIQSFITAHENSFSFFGWFVRLFVKTDTTN
ncbi:MAG: hypothetical protein Q7J45_02050 [bacterium]|nr:hypothetical protein [bacterium]